MSRLYHVAVYPARQRFFSRHDYTLSVPSYLTFSIRLSFVMAPIFPKTLLLKRCVPTASILRLRSELALNVVKGQALIHQQDPSTGSGQVSGSKRCPESAKGGRPRRTPGGQRQRRPAAVALDRCVASRNRSILRQAQDGVSANLRSMPRLVSAQVSARPLVGSARHRLGDAREDDGIVGTLTRCDTLVTLER